MASALSPSMINIQVPFADAGHLKAPGYLSQPTSSAPSPQKKQRHSSPNKGRALTASVSASSSPLKKSGTGFKRTTSTANIMDTVMNSRVATDHDAVPIFGLGLPTSTSNIFEYRRSSPIASSSQTTLADLENNEAANVLSTPRRGKRVGNVHMGWESPLDADQTPTAASVAATAPHTLPKSSRTRTSAQSASVEASPSKRKASTAFASELRLSRRSLVDTAGWASAAMISSVPLSEDRINSSPGFSPRFVTEPVMTGLATAETRDPLAAFTNDASPVCSQNPRLVPVEVEGLGRVAVHPDFAQQIAESPRVAQSDAHRRFSTASEREAALLRGSDSEDSAARSENGSSTDPTSAGTPCPSGVSPSFSLSSQFPCSEPISPTKKGATSASYSEHHASDTQKALSALMRVAPADAMAQQEAKLWCPRLGGSTATVVAKLPTLDWPDRPDGPWSAAGRHIDELKQKRRQGIQRWLESDSADETQDDAQESSGAAYRHHPMVAKALLDRARKQHRTQMSAAAVAAASAISPSKRGRKPKQPHLLHVHETPSKRRGRKPKVAASIASSSRKSVATGASLARSNTSAIIGCKCGIDDDSIIMVQCDGCRSWLHLPCVGVNTVNDLDDEWYCDDCCDAALTEHLSPASSMPTSIGSYAHLSTPEALEAALAGQEPVFTLPSGTPIHRYGVAVSSSIALAPSPPLLSVGDRGGRSTAKRQGQGRSRAERVGWRINEPGSPLARKSTTASSGVRPAVPETPSESSEATVDFTDASATPSLLAGFSRADWEPTRARRASERQTTPTRVLGMSTPSRHASGRKPSHSGPLSLGLCDDEPPHADLFSTPSRLASGGSWAYRAGGQPLGSQTPSRSGGRHQRIDSFSGGLLSTPGRDFLSSAFGTEPSTSMPSLVYSSGYIDGLDDHLSGDGFYSGSNSRAWQLQSPTSSTRAARARQPSGFGTPWSSSLLKTPELQPRQAHTSSVRSGRHDTSDDFPPSSSPFPRTPTFDMSSPRFTPHGSHHSSGAHERHPSHLGLGLPSSSSARLHKALGADLHKGGASRDDRSLSASAHAKHRQVSTEVPMGLGIGLDLDDVLDWS